MTSVLSRLGIEPSERALCGWTALCFTLLGATAFALLNSAETLFLKRVGVAYLPWALLASAGLLVITTGATSRGLADADRPRAVPRVLFGLAALLLPLWWLLQELQVPAVFGASYFNDLSGLTADEGAGQIIATNPSDTKGLDPAGKEVDIDTEDDYNELYTSFGS